jgi:uncharacterized protein YecE (DUF72 family)
MNWLVGTSGYAYKEWKGAFYPDKLPARGMLEYYATQLPAVEINNTFYRLPKATVLDSWAGQVPASFRFALKASRRITHFKRLKGAEDETEYLLDTARTLGSRLGVILFQLPPGLPCDLERLARFVDQLPEDTRAAFEFRHPSWACSDVEALLRDRNLAWVVNDDDEAPAEALTQTASWGYLRLRRAGYDRAALADWARRIAATGWEHAFVFFKHEDAGAGPRMAAEFLELAARQAERKSATRRPSDSGDQRESA